MYKSAVCFSLLLLFSFVSTSNAASSEATFSEHQGGIIFNIPTREFEQLSERHEAKEESEARKESKKQYAEFLSRGRYSRLRSIGGGYSGSSSAPSGSVGTSSVVRSNFNPPRSKRSGFASIENGGTYLGRSSGRGFATIKNK